MKKILLGTVAAITLGMAAQASAADMAARPYTKAPPMIASPVYDWTGFYIGVMGGYGEGRHDRVNTGGFANRYNSDGGFGGGTVGYNWQTQAFVFGVEGDVAAADIRGQDNFVGGTNDQTTLRFIGTARGRIGLAWNQVLFFGTGGYAYGDQRHVNTNPGVGIEAFTRGTSGWTAGGGIEWGFAPNWSAKAEYRYFDFESYSRPAPTNGNLPYSVDSKYSTVLVGINYRWGGPVVARY